MAGLTPIGTVLSARKSLNGIELHYIGWEESALPAPRIGMLYQKKQQSVIGSAFQYGCQLYRICFDIRHFRVIVFESKCIKPCSVYDYNTDPDVALSNEYPLIHRVSRFPHISTAAALACKERSSERLLHSSCSPHIHMHIEHRYYPPVNTDTCTLQVEL